jgi:putative glycosyltransferase (TIGR04372 family)
MRMGDPPQLPNVVDYCRGDMRSDWMDIFPMVRSRFMLGSASGPSFVPPLYGVPAVPTNWWPPGMRLWHAADIFIPKLLRRSADGRALTLSETVAEPFPHCHSPRYLAAREGVHVEDNDPEIIRGAVAEMLSRLDGSSRRDADVAELRARRSHLPGPRAFRHGAACRRLSPPPWRLRGVIAVGAKLTGQAGR